MVSSVVVPAIKIVVWICFVGGIFYFVGKAIWNGWTKRYKFVFKYNLTRKNPPERIVKWCLDNIDNNVDYYQVKKFLMVKGYPRKEINEILWVYEQLIKEMKGGKDKNGRKFKGIGREIKAEEGELPKYSTDFFPRG